MGRPAEERLKKTGQHDFEVNEDGGRLDGDGGQGPCGYNSQVNQDGRVIFFSHLVCERVMLTGSSSPGEGGAGEEPRSQDFVLVTW